LGSCGLLLANQRAKAMNRNQGLVLAGGAIAAVLAALTVKEEKGDDMSQDQETGPRGFELDRASLLNLAGVHPYLQKVVLAAADRSPVKFAIIEGGGLRTQEQANDNAERGTGIKSSLHLRQPSGYSHAVDLVVVKDGALTWEQADLGLYEQLSRVVFEAADEQGVPLQWGKDWDDYPHFQLPKWPHRKQEAWRAMNDRRLERGLPEIADPLTV
jgi:hypothetical protein